MPRNTSPYVVGDQWLDKRRDGKAPDVWQIARAVKRSVVYRSTNCRGLEDAKAAIEVFAAEQRSKSLQPAEIAGVGTLLMIYWQERGKKAVNNDQAARSLRTFIAFLAQDTAGARAVVTDLVPAMFERFREWRMSPHAFSIAWGGDLLDYASKGVSGATVQRNINDVRAAVHHAEANRRIPFSPRIPDVESRYKSEPRDRVLTIGELGRIAWYASHNTHLFRFVTLQFATAIRPQAALKFDPAKQYDPATNLIDQQPSEAPQTKKRNAIVPAIRPFRPVLRAWARAGATPVGSRKTSWRIMRRAIGLGPDVHPKTIRHTVATMLYADETVPERQIEAMLGHDPALARTTRIYAKYRPEHLGKAVAVLTKLWLDVSRAARAYGADHTLTTVGQGGKNVVEEKAKKC